MKKFLASILVILVLAALAGCDLDSGEKEPVLDWSKIEGYNPDNGEMVLGTALAILDGTNGRYRETVLGNFIMDGIAEYARFISGEKVDFALHNGQNLRQPSLPSGDIANTAILDLIGADSLVIVDYTGLQIKNLINILINSDNPGTWRANCAVMVSREVSYTIVPSGEPDPPERPNPPTAANIMVNGVAINDTAVYRVAVGNFLAGANADGTVATSGGAFNIRNNDPLGIGAPSSIFSYDPIQLRHALAQYVLAKGTISPSDYALGRITGTVPVQPPQP